MSDDTHRPQLGRVYSDASAVGWGALHLCPDAPTVTLPPDLAASLDGSVDGPPKGWTVGGRFSEADRALSSGAREVRAVVLAIGALGLRGGHVAWHCDATVAVFSITTWSSRADHVAQALSELWDALHVRDLTITVTHVLRDASFMPVADWLSRAGWRDRQAEWAVDRHDIDRICAALGVRCNADMFASARNRRFSVYCSRWLEEGAMGDAFHVPWTGRCWWVFPPFSQLDRFISRFLALKHLEAASIALASSSSSASALTWSPVPPSGLPLAVTGGGLLSSSPSSSQSAPLIGSSRTTFVLLYPDSPAVLGATRLPELRSLATRDLLVCSARLSSRQLCPDLRLRDGDGVPAPKAPPWPLRVLTLHVRL